jgi:hypothetical protein
MKFFKDITRPKVTGFGILNTTHDENLSYNMLNQSTEGAAFVWISKCQKDEGCEIINQFAFV